ncbi:MAG: ribosome small subunit-dependent GTPase A [Mariprofundales bacterium]
MNNISNKLKTIGFDKCFLDNVSPEVLEQFNIARVVAVHRNSYIISTGDVDLPAELLGKIAFSASSPSDYPAVGDWVLVHFHDENKFAIIHEILPRKSLIKRKTPDKKVSFQLIAANIDVAFIVQSMNKNFNPRRLERYLVMVNDSKIQPIVLLSKSDLLDQEYIKDIIALIHKAMPDLQVITFSNENESYLDNVKVIMQAGLTYCLMGSSGVGKTTLINNLIGEAKYKTKAVSKKDNKGMHATTHRQMIKLDFGALVIDTPGMRELGNFSVATGLGETFAEIAELSEKCQFNDCTHVNQKACAVINAVNDGQLSAERYQNYIKMKKESTFNEMSYIEKKRKNKQFGKLIKTANKHKKRRK